MTWGSNVTEEEEIQADLEKVRALIRENRRLRSIFAEYGGRYWEERYRDEAKRLQAAESIIRRLLACYDDAPPRWPDEDLLQEAHEFLNGGDKQ